MTYPDPFRFNFFMDLLFIISAGIPANKPDYGITLPATVFDFFTQKEILTGDPKTIVGDVRGGQDVFDLLGKFIRQALISIHQQDPFIFGFRDRPILLVRRAAVAPLKDLSTQFLGNIRCAVGTVRIYDQDLVGPVYRSHRFPDIGTFVVSSNDNT